MKYFVTEDRLLHLMNHFSGNKSTGSYFFDNVFDGIYKLLEYVNAHEPREIICQMNGNQVHVFEYEGGKEVGFVGFDKKKNVLGCEVIREMRNNYLTEFALVEKMKATPMFCVVVRAVIQMEVITTFPGPFAPPFPYSGQNEHENKVSSAFWEEHILIKRK